MPDVEIHTTARGLGDTRSADEAGNLEILAPASGEVDEIPAGRTRRVCNKLEESEICNGRKRAAAIVEGILEVAEIVSGSDQPSN